MQIPLDTLLPLGILVYFLVRILYEFTLNRKNIPTIATGFFEQRAMIKILKAAAEDKTVFQIVDCGSGSGELTRHVAWAMPKAQVTGLELSAWPYKKAEFFKDFFCLKNLTYKNISFFDHDFRGVDAAMIYLSGHLTQKLGEKLWAELKPQALVITNEFPLLGAWQPQYLMTRYTPFKTTLFIYRR